MRPGKSRRGQVLIFFGMTMALLLGLVSLVIDFGFIYSYQSELNASTQAAVLAGAQAMAEPGATVTSTNNAINAYSSVSGGYNAHPNLPNVSMVSGYPLYSCLTTLQTLYGIQCYGASGANAVVVKQKLTVPLMFARLFGVPSVILSSTATAAMKGALAGPFNVVIIVDATGSMNSTDSDSNCSGTRISCAMAGVRVLLQHLSPCLPSSSTCGTVTNGNVVNSVDRVSLLTFPAVTAATAVDDYNCGGTNPTTVGYTYPNNTGTYQVVNFSSDYRTSDTISTLNANSNISAAVGGKTGTPCLHVVGGYGTYYAQVIRQAQTYLTAEQALFPGSQNVMVLLSDGDASSSSGQMPGASTVTGTYMSTKKECHQAITEALAAKTAGTRVYSVAYGAAASGCSTDTSPAITPCQTMEQIASAPGYFFSDYTATGGSSSCISASQPVTSLSQIFQVIAYDLTVPKLIPDNTQ